MNQTPRKLILILILLLSFTAFALRAQPVSGRKLHGHVPPAVARLAPLKRMAADQELQLAIALPVRDADGLSNFVNSVSDPASPQYRQYLTPPEFTERFGPAAKDYEAVRRFAERSRFVITATHPNRLLLDVRASAAAIEKAFQVQMHVFQHPGEARTFFAPTSEPIVDAGVPILSISGLEDYELSRPMGKSRRIDPRTFAQSYTTGSGPIGYVIGKDLRNAYMPGVQADGAGEAVGIFSLDGYFANDVTLYEGMAGLPNVPLTNVLLNNFSGAAGSHNDEAILDITMAISMAPGLSRVIMYEGTVPNDILNAMANDNQARQLSSSWGFGSSIDPARDQIFLQFAAQGQSFFQASGDNGAWTGGVYPPSDNPYITVVGGTSLETSTPGGPWASETVWPGSGGGISTSYAIPPWQQGLNMVTNQGSTTMRNLPDVAAMADSFFFNVAFNGEFFITSGTSASAPMWAGLCALANQQAAANGQPAIGFLNPALYAIGKSASYKSCFHDIVSGNNTNSGSTNLFFAKPGYDLCTGWGTPAGGSLLSNLSVPPATLRLSSTDDLFASGPAGGPFVPTNLVYGVSNFTSVPLNWSLIETSSWLKGTPLSGTLSPGGPSTNIVFSFTAAATNLSPGSYASTVVFNGSDFSSQTRRVVLAVVTTPTMASNPTNISTFENMPAIFTASATSNGFVGWQWWFDNGSSQVALVDGANISGAKTSTLTILNATATNEGSYFAVATNGAGTATSSSALLSLVPWRPVIIAQPTNQTVLPGQLVQLSVTAAGSQPLSYQWQLNGTNINMTNAFIGGMGLYGWDSNVLTIPIAANAHAGVYSVLITNALGSVQSTGAMLTVAPLIAPGVALSTAHTFSLFQSPLPPNPTNSGPRYSSAIDGAEPNELLALPSGELVGTTRHGGTNDAGVLFHITGGGMIPRSFDTLHHFVNTNDGATPFAPLRLGSDGRYYGTAFQGGAAGNGSIYTASTNGAVGPLVTLNGGIGDFPYSPVTPGQDGNFYGTTYKGAGGFGTVFKLTPNGTLTTLKVFSGGADGSLPYAGLVQAPKGRLYGTTYKGGAFGYGTVFSITTNGAFSTLFSFGKTNGASVYAGLLMSDDGFLYGATAEGGAFGSGTLFRISTSGQFAKLYDFPGGAGGRAPHATLMQAGDGNIYGTTMFGGYHDKGTVFRFAPGSVPTTLVQFDSFNGANPDAGLVQSIDGIYGTTPHGGAPNVGLIYALNYSGLAPQITAQPQNQSVFMGADVLLSAAVVGSSPLTYYWRRDGTNLVDTGHVTGAGARVLAISNVSLVDIGSYSLFVSNAWGSITSADATLQVTSSPPYIVSQPAGQTLPPGGFATFAVAAFGNSPLTYQWQKNGTNISDGGNLAGANTDTLQVSSVIEPNSGAYRLIITNALGAVTSTPAILDVVPPSVAGTRFATLYSFAGGVDGGNANGLTTGTNGHLYGTTQLGGAASGGTLFSLTTNGGVTILSQFGGSIGTSPKSALALSSDGNLYGAAANGGGGAAGTIFRVAADGTLSNLYSFSGGADGAHPVGGLAVAQDGTLFGTTQNGGIGDLGTVFLLSPGGSFTNLHSFTNGVDGAHPAVALTRSRTGTFYGITPAGANGQGNVFSITSAGAFANLYTFVDSGDGAWPVGPLVQGSDGSLFGATRNFNLSGYELPGGIFRMTTNGAVGSMYVFNSFFHDGLGPDAGVIEGSDGNLYGTTEFGGNLGNGVVYRLTPSGGYTTLYEFDSFNSGARPQTPVVEGPDGAFYGSTSTGGPGGQGTVFKLSMTAAPQITMQPANATVTPGSDVRFVVASFGGPVLGYTWRKNGTNVSDGGNLSGSLTRILTLTNISTANTGSYSVVITNSLGSVTSTVVVLKVVFPPVVQNAARSGNSFVLTYTTIPGQRYRVQAVNSLTNPIWTGLGVPATASGTTLTYSDPVGVNTQRFYRVMLIPN